MARSARSARHARGQDAARRRGGRARRGDERSQPVRARPPVRCRPATRSPRARRWRRSPIGRRERAKRSPVWPAASRSGAFHFRLEPTRVEKARLSRPASAGLKPSPSRKAANRPTSPSSRVRSSRPPAAAARQARDATSASWAWDRRARTPRARSGGNSRPGRCQAGPRGRRGRVEVAALVRPLATCALTADRVKSVRRQVSGPPALDNEQALAKGLAREIEQKPERLHDRRVKELRFQRLERRANGLRRASAGIAGSTSPRHVQDARGARRPVRLAGTMTWPWRSARQASLSATPAPASRPAIQALDRDCPAATSSEPRITAAGARRAGPRTSSAPSCPTRRGRPGRDAARAQLGAPVRNSRPSSRLIEGDAPPPVPRAVAARRRAWPPQRGGQARDAEARSRSAGVRSPVKRATRSS